MQIQRQFTISSMLMRQILDKYNSQNARYPVEYLEAVLDEDDGTVFIGPRTLTMEVSGERFRGSWLWDGGERAVLVDHLRIVRMHRDFCTVSVAYEDDPHFIGMYEPFVRRFQEPDQ